MKNLKREVVINQLIGDEVIKCKNDDLYLIETVKYGCAGFAHLSNRDLMQEYIDTYGEEVKISS